MYYTDEERKWMAHMGNVVCPHCRKPGPQIIFWCDDLIGPHARLRCDCGCLWDQDDESQNILVVDLREHETN
jgi:hypothetical protein